MKAILEVCARTRQLKGVDLHGVSSMGQKRRIQWSWGDWISLIRMILTKEFVREDERKEKGEGLERSGRFELSCCHDNVTGRSLLKFNVYVNEIIHVSVYLCSHHGFLFLFLLPCRFDF